MDQLDAESALPPQTPLQPPTEDAEDSEDTARDRERLKRRLAQMRTGVISPTSKRSPQTLDLGQEAQEDEEGAVISFYNADIAEVAQEIFGTVLGVNFILDPELSGTVSLHMEGEFSRQELLDVVIRAFRESGVDVVKQGDAYLVQPMQKSSSELAIASVKDLLPGSSEVPSIVIFRPRHIKAEKAAELVKNFLTPGRPLIVEPRSNTLIFVETPGSSRSILELLHTMDFNLLNEISMEIVPLKSLEPEAAIKSLDTIINKMDMFKESAATENLAFLPLDHFNGVLILSQDRQLLLAAKDWLLALDIKGEELGEQIYIYKVENGLAKNIAEILNEVFGGSEKKSDSTKTTSTLTQHVVEAESQSAVAPEGAVVEPAPVPEATAEYTDVSSKFTTTRLTGKALIIPDETNNAVVVRANAQDMEKIKNVMIALDIRPRAVLIEVIIAEVRLTGQLSYGVEWFLRNSNFKIGGEEVKGSVSQDFGTGFDFDYNLGGSSSGAIPAGLSMFMGSVSGPTMFAGLLTLLDSDNNVNILATPTLLAQDNKEATISIGGSEPIVTQISERVSEDTDALTTTNQVKYEDTGIMLKVTPHINSSGLVAMDIVQEIRTVNNQQLEGVDLNTPRFTERKITTSITAESGKTAVIGGIIQSTNSDINSGIPLLKDIPYLGMLFSRTELKTEKTELLIAITPYVLKKNIDKVKDEFIERLRNLRQRIEEDNSSL